MTLDHVLVGSVVPPDPDTGGTTGLVTEHLTFPLPLTDPGGGGATQPWAPKAQKGGIMSFGFPKKFLKSFFGSIFS